MEVRQANRNSNPGSAGRRRLGGHGRSAGPDGIEGVVSGKAVAETLAILMVDLIRVLPAQDRHGTLERLANRVDDQARTPGGGETAGLLGAVAEALMQLET